VVLLENPQEAGTINASKSLEINQLLSMFPARSIAFIKELLTTKTVAEALEELLSPKDPQEEGCPRKKQKRNGALPIRENSYCDIYRRWARYYLLSINRHVPINVIEAIFFNQQHYFTGTLIEILSKIEAGEIILSEFANTSPSQPESPDQPPVHLKKELDAYSNKSTIRDLRNAYAISKAELVECLCCYSEFPVDFKTTRCESSHHFCFDCAAKGLKLKMGRVKSLSCFECGIMIDGCKDVIPTSEIQLFLPPKAFARTRSFLLHLRVPRIAEKGRVV
jgi:hypothetical protein